MLTVFSRSGSSSDIILYISNFYKVNEFTVAVILILALMLLAIQAVKPNKAISEIVTPMKNCVLLSIRI